MRSSRILTALLVLAAMASSAVAQTTASTQTNSTYAPSSTDPKQLNWGNLPVPLPPPTGHPPNTMMEGISAEAKMNAAQSMMMINPLSLRQMMNLMVAKKQAKDGLSFDDVIESMKVRANKVNFKLVGHNPLSKDVVAITGKTDTPRVEIFSFCDAVVAREILDYSPEFIAFLPCRIAVLEDSKKKIWLVTMDWDVRWMDTSRHQDKISESLRAKAIKIREGIEQIMDAGAKGDL
jgi:uncharacterized protein (DUF302 family)